MGQVRRLTELDSADVEAAGGKGTNLGEMTRTAPPAIAPRHRVPQVR